MIDCSDRLTGKCPGMVRIHPGNHSLFFICDKCGAEESLQATEETPSKSRALKLLDDDD